MIKINSLYINGGSYNYGKYATTPIQLQETIDGSLDLLYVELKNVLDEYLEPYSYPFKPFSNVELVLTDGETDKTLYMVVESDNVEEVIKNKTYNHKLMLIEETKSAERYFVDKSINQPLIIRRIAQVRQNATIVREGSYFVSYKYELDGVYTSYINGEYLPSVYMFKGDDAGFISGSPTSFKDSKGNDIKYKDGVETPLIPLEDLVDGETYTLTYYIASQNGAKTDMFSFICTDDYISNGKYIKIKTKAGVEQERNEEPYLKLSRYCDKDTELPKINSFIPNLSFFNDYSIKIEGENINLDITDDIDADGKINKQELHYGNEYNIKYTWFSQIGDEKTEHNYIFPIIWVQKDDKTLAKRVKDVIESLFSTTITLRNDETPKFSIASIDEYNKSEKYKKRIEEIYNSISPEFSFSKMSLVEALRMIGDKYGFEPRFKNNKLFLDLVGINEKESLSSTYYSNVSSQSSNEFCNKLDSFVSNLVNNIDVNEGAVKEPMAFAYKTIRTDYGQTHITTDNMLFATQFPIEKPIKLEIGYIKTGNTEVLVSDITNFLYEESEYNLLPSLEDVYPGSKKYALKYKRGEKNITGLYFKMEKPTSVQEFFEQYAIQNIIRKKTGILVNDIFEIQYRLTYIPIINARITQVRQDVQGTNTIVSLAYNQGATKVESQSFGGNLKVNVNKLGNPSKTKMFIIPRIKMLPTLSNVVDDNYVITTIKSEYYPKFIKCEVELTKNYTKKNEYIGVNSNLDLFEYDRRNTIDRHVVYEDFCIITEKPVLGVNTSLITEDGCKEFSGSFCSKSYFNGVDVNMVRVTAIDIENNELNSVVMPLISLGFGNSMAFMFEYIDTITADTSVKTTSGGFREQYYYEYVDNMGSFEKLQIELGTPTTPPENYQKSVYIGDNLPQGNVINDLGSIILFSTNNNNLIIKKDVGERICFTYQIHFICDDNYIIGSAFGSRNNLVSGSGNFEYIMYFLNDRLDKMQDKVIITDNDKSIKFKEENIVYWNGGMEFDNIVAPDGEFKSWAIVDIKDGRNDLIFGKNVDIKGGEKVVMPSLYFKHKLED